MRRLLRGLGIAILGLCVVGSLQLPARWLAPSPALAVIGPCTPSFSQPTGSPISVGAGADPVSVAMADFNGDTQPDLAVANGSASTVSILLGNGTGGFTPEGAAIGGLSGPSAVVAADFNGDSRSDLAISNFSGGTVMILLRNPVSGFNLEGGAGIVVGGNPVSLAVGDFNGDARPDLAVGNFATDSVTILQRNAGPGFTPVGAPIGFVGHPVSLTTGHFNDGTNVDLAAALSTSHTVGIALGNGDGTFSIATGSPFAVPTAPFSVAVGSFNGDAAQDLAVASFGADGVAILLGNGGGGFTSATGSPFSTGTDPQAAVVGNLNNDGFADLAVANSGSANVTILLGNGNGGFTPAAGSPVGAGAGSASLALGDFNLDGDPDLAVANAGPDNVTILLNSCLVADLGVTIADLPDPVVAGENMIYTVTVSHVGPDLASTVTLSDPLPAGTTFVSLAAPAGWSCSTPAVGAGGTVNCSIATLAAGSVEFGLVVNATSAGTLTNTVTVDAATADNVGTNNSANTSTTVLAPTATPSAIPTVTPTVTPTPTSPPLATPIPTVPPGPCAPRPAVSVVVGPASPDRLRVTIQTSDQPATPGNRLIELRATIPPNARVDVPGGPSDLAGQQVLPVGGGTQPVVFFVRRVGGPGAVTVPLVAVDTCGEWPTFVGGGVSAF